MKKVKLQFTHDQLTAIHDYIEECMRCDVASEEPMKLWAWRVSIAVLAKWVIKVKGRLQFHKPKHKMTIDPATASSLMIVFQWVEEPVTTHLGNTILITKNTIDQTLCR